MDLGGSVFDGLMGISVYQGVRESKLVKKFLRLLEELNKQKPQFSKAVKQYRTICEILYQPEYEASLPDCLQDLILCDINVFTTASAHKQYDTLPQVVKHAAKGDLRALYALSQVTSQQVKDWMSKRFPEKAEAIGQLGDYVNEQKHPGLTGCWQEQLETLAKFHEQNGISLFTKYCAFYLADGERVEPVRKFEPVSLTTLKKYELQKKQITDNTLSFLHGKPANNVLLYGDRGTGKSTTVNGILTEYRSQGLRMIQISKEDILRIHKVLEVIRQVPLRFIIFIDDLTFNENDECFNTLKAVLEGSLNAMPENALIYATTNRRHLIKETFSSREGDELHASDTRDEIASLADRFGLTVTFTKPNLSDFLEIVCEIARERELSVDEETLRRGANIFAMKKASRSGRVARQYVDYVEGRLSLGLPL
ncbi:MAG: ATP-binding protein [Massiliimalia sp.]|jgi:predicted AAA+ superfamily ATPase